MVWASLKKKSGDANPLNFFQRLAAGKTFQRGREKPHGAPYGALTSSFLTTDLNNSFYTLGHVELWKRSKKIGGILILVRALQTIQYEGSCLILKPSSSSKAVFRHTVDLPRRLKGIVQPFELGGETRLIRSAVKY